MAHALAPVSACDILKSHPLLTFRAGPYSYTIRRDGDRSVYTVTDGAQTIEAPLEWAFGLGDAGQTYVFQREGSFYESRVSFYRALNGLDLTIGARTVEPRDLAEAAGRKMNGQDARDCFQCHSTGAVHGDQLKLDAMQPGVQCEDCHGSAARHVEAVRSGNAAAAAMPKLAALSTEEMSDKCGACHRTWAQIAESGPFGVLNVRFQPYRLASSRCYDSEDRRISCTACHNPHNHAVHDAAFYDSKCQACHSSPKSAAKMCTVAKSNCVSCHMPKIDLPGAHFAFTDHLIRVQKKGAPYPD